MSEAFAQTARKCAMRGGRRSTSGQGRPKGVPNKIPAALKEMVLAALNEVGGVEYLMRQAEKNPAAFMTLLGRVLPTTLANDPDGTPIRHIVEWAKPGDTGGADADR